MNLHVDILGISGVIATLDHVDRGVSVMRPLWEQFGEEFYRQETDHFNRADFVPLSPTYAERKREQFGDKPILRATDALFLSFTQQGAEGNIHRINDLDAEFGSSDFKAILHQEGTSRMPARPPQAEPDEDRYESIAAQYIEELIN